MKGRLIAFMGEAAELCQFFIDPSKASLVDVLGASRRPKFQKTIDRRASYRLQPYLGHKDGQIEWMEQFFVTKSREPIYSSTSYLRQQISDVERR